MPLSAGAGDGSRKGLGVRYLLAITLMCLAALGSAAAVAAQPLGVLPGQWLLSIASNGDRFSFDIDCQAEGTSTIQFSVTGIAVPLYGGFDGTFEEQGTVTIDATGHVATFTSAFTIYADDGTVVTGMKELDTSETAGIATGACGTDPSGSCFADTTPIDLRYSAATSAGTETGTARTNGIDAYQTICGGATDGAFEEEFLATDGAPSEPTTLTLEPLNAENVVGEAHTVTATLVDQYGDPVQDYTVRLSVSGAVTANGSCITNVLGQCSFTFDGALFPGAATVTACTDAFGDSTWGTCDPGPTATATKAYVLPSSTPGATSGGGRIGTTTVSLAVRSDGDALSGYCAINAGATTINCLDAIAYVQSGGTSTIYGNATINGVETLYRIRVGDSGSGGDTFSILTASGYELTGTLSAGNFRIR
jgi:hypothetical protein